MPLELLPAVGSIPGYSCGLLHSDVMIRSVQRVTVLFCFFLPFLCMLMKDFEVFPWEQLLGISDVSFLDTC